MARVRRRGATAAATTATTKRSNHPKMRQKKLPKSQATTPSRTLSDMLLSIKPHHLANIISREKKSRISQPPPERWRVASLAIRDRHWWRKLINNSYRHHPTQHAS
ncbi:unnamed protein product [Fusarium graminearum]|uniref:Chromosome 1, complete genome n=1 Tax=Gibberella zeae (strain ATCC MYA-4620 / CBS 123657 / FGSC 9075 / NRRL 31084 / PH-1) TaxID=229533 RepID=I1RF47_GIBZE|nr:hypothetical protein FGSG_02313 [Fusarium graminearum PH-1]ESU07737.1 hypothetical protein FGSG_02313 [Fusarium graminearum PH-1]EYB30978.1 hypothetical protein FG05_02313 [Fusarium graminearum]CEF74590.1 unnamed protein product [Fusarium graminearum]CZS77865.1 unnamed protein product [Fusarium graminearum]|eukprot:XP_011318222.1 hypothetical protein FGSG_02313 [Fusarium graminearum PH-1]